MEAQAPEVLAPGQGLQETRRDHFTIQSGAMREVPHWAAAQHESTPHLLEFQWQDFLKTVQSPSMGWGNPQLPELASWDDLIHFERVFGACRWPRGDGVAWLMPAFSTEAQQAFSSWNSRDKADYGKVKAAFLQGNSTSTEIHRQRFRQFCYQEAEGPREVCSRLRELCHCWLEPEGRTKEQIIELLILEQFLTILPLEIQNQVRERSPETCAQAVALAEGFILRQLEGKQPEDQRSRSFQGVAVDFSEAQRSPLKTRQRPLGRQARKQDNCSTSSLVNKIANKTEEKPEHQESREEEVPTAPEGAQKKEKSHLCTECGKSFTRPSDLAKHLNVHTGEKPYLCVECGKSFTRPSDLAKHLNVHTGEKPYLCVECGKSFTRPSDLAKHLNVHTGEKPYLCVECGKSFSQLSHLTRHQKIHSGEKPHICSECGDAFSQRAYLVSHQRSHSGEQPYRCSYCHKCFSHQSALKIHERNHMGQKPYACVDCGKRFVSSSSLTTHRRIHTGEKPHACGVCGKRFIQHSNLVSHQRTHSGEKPFSCKVCGRRFAYPSDLTRHQKIHTGEKPYPCDECERRFTRLSDLITHQRIHTGEKPYRCLECGRRFRQRGVLVKHQKCHSKEDPKGGESEQLPECQTDSEFRSGEIEPEGELGNRVESSLISSPSS